MITLDQIKEATSAYIEENSIGELEYVNDNEEIGGLLFTQIEQEGGEGEGDDYHFVLQVTNKDKTDNAYLMVSGSYTSYDGTDFYSVNDCFSLVEPEMVQVRKWKTVK